MKYHDCYALKWHILLTVVTCCILGAHGRDEALYTSDGDLSSTLINKILYDSKGMVWVATEDGLNRFDGSKFTIFHHIPDDSTSLASDFVNNIFESSDGRLFVASHNGVQIFDHMTETFSPPLRDNMQNLTPHGISDIVETTAGDLYTVGNDIFKIAADGSHLESTILPDYISYVHRAVFDSGNNCWLTKGTDGVYCVRADSTIHHYFGTPGGPEIISLAVTPDGTVYAGSMLQGFYRYNAEIDDFELIDLGPDKRDIVIRDIYQDDMGNVLLATDGNGMLVYRPGRNKTITFQLSLPDHQHLKVHSITKDPNGNLWVGIYQKGLMKIPPRSSIFRTISHNSQIPSLIGNSCVSSVLLGSDGTLWIGTDNDGIYTLRRDQRGSVHIKDVPPVVIDLFEDRDGNVWMGSYGGGAGKVDRWTGKFTPISMPGTKADANKVFDMLQLPDGDILIATMGAGVFRHNPATGATSLFVDENHGINQWVNSMSLSADATKLYLGTYYGLYTVDLTTAEPTVSHSIPGVIVTTIYADSRRDDLWAGTPDGLIRLDTSGNRKEEYTVAEGLPSNTVYAIEDDGVNLWISSNRGLSRFNPADGTFINYNVRSGLPQNEFAKNSSFRDKNGHMYFGGINGLVFFDPEQVGEDGRKLTLRVTDFFIGDEAVRPGMRSGRREIIDRPVFEAETFRLSHDDNTFAIRVNNLEYAEAEDLEYFYSFDNDEWTRIIGNSDMYGGAILTFSNVPSGEHQLRIKALCRGVESDTLTLTIDVAPVWYATWWAKLIYALIAAAIGYVIYSHYRRRSRKRQEEVERHHQAQMMESKLQFFANISHEIRTPLTLVISPLQKLLENDKDPDRNYTYRTILRNAKRILRLINELMDLRKLDNNQMKMRFVRLDLCGFLSDLYETFLPAAKSKGVTLNFAHAGCDNLDIWADRSNLDKIVMNLLSNAMKFTPSGGKVTMTLSRGEDPAVDSPLREYAEISVTDTGIGISEEDRGKIFNRFYQASNNHSGGTGIGLHLSYQLVELHQGTISVETNPEGQGTRFVVRIPMGCGHLDPASMVTSEEAQTAPMPVEATAVEAINIPDEETPETGADARKKKKGTVFVVEDDDEIRRYLATSLSGTYKVMAYANGKAALDEIYDKKPDLVITDVMMPEMDGITLIRKIKQNINLNHIPVVVLTAKSSEESNLEALDSGAAAFIPKPFSIDVVTKTVEKLIESNQRLRVAFSGQQNQEDKVEDIKVQSNDEKLMERVMREINKNLSNSDITVEMIAKSIGISRVHLHRKLKELTNQSTRDFIRNIRLQAAAKLLREKKLSVAEVSDLVGFKQPNNFSTCFKEMYGMTPTAYCQKHHGEGAEGGE